MLIQLQAEQFRDGRWCVRPAGTVGTCGFSPVPWTAFIGHRCNSAKQAIEQCRREVAWARSEVMPRLFGAIVIHVGKYAGAYHDDEIAVVITQAIRDNKRFGAYGRYWTYDGDAFFEECGFALEDSDAEFYGREALNKLREHLTPYITTN